MDNLEEGIYSAMAKANADGYVYVTVSWENQVQQDFEQFEASIKKRLQILPINKVGPVCLNMGF